MNSFYKTKLSWKKSQKEVWMSCNYLISDESVKIYQEGYRPFKMNCWQMCLSVSHLPSPSLLSAVCRAVGPQNFSCVSPWGHTLHSWGCMHSLNAALLLCEFRLEGDLHKSSLTRGTKASSVGPLGWKEDKKWFTDLLCMSCIMPLCPRGFHLLGLPTLHNCSGNCVTRNQLESYNWLLKVEFLK